MSTGYVHASRVKKVKLASKNITRNGTYSPDEGIEGFSEVVVNVEGGGGEIKLQSKTATKNGEVVTPDEGYDGLDKVTVDIQTDPYILPAGHMEVKGGIEGGTSHAPFDELYRVLFYPSRYADNRGNLPFFSYSKDVKHTLNSAGITSISSGGQGVNSYEKRSLVLTSGTYEGDQISGALAEGDVTITFTYLPNGGSANFKVEISGADVLASATDFDFRTFNFSGIDLPDAKQNMAVAFVSLFKLLGWQAYEGQVAPPAGGGGGGSGETKAYWFKEQPAGTITIKEIDDTDIGEFQQFASLLGTSHYAPLKLKAKSDDVEIAIGATLSNEEGSRTINIEAMQASFALKEAYEILSQGSFAEQVIFDLQYAEWIKKIFIGSEYEEVALGGGSSPAGGIYVPGELTEFTLTKDNWSGTTYEIDATDYTLESVQNAVLGYPINATQANNELITSLGLTLMGGQYTGDAQNNYLKISALSAPDTDITIGVFGLKAKGESA